ncbi:MFS transporter [Streptomyces sp. NPDC057939]|uniref:MFS transporter n=1 Tax=Streptomyces sp. NPDC057939 TaxID=3346284 RepID=UPI0036EC19FC
MCTFRSTLRSLITALAGPSRDLRTAAAGKGALAFRDFRLFLLSQSVAGTGTWVQRTAQDWLVLQLTGSVAAVGLVVTVQCLPALLCGLWGGSVADRYRRRPLMLMCNAFSATLALAMTVLVLTGTARMWSVCVLAGLLGLVSALEGPTRQAFIPQLVAQDARRSATGLSAAGFQLARIVGPALAGLVIACLGIGWTFLFCAGLTVLCAATLLAVRSSGSRGGAPAGGRSLPASARRDATASPARDGAVAAVGSRAPGGIREVAAHPKLRCILMLSGLMGLVGLNFAVLLPALATTGFGAAPQSFGLLSTMLAVGALGGALLASRLRACPIRVLAVSALALAALQTAAGFAPSLQAFGIVLVPLGAAALCFTTTASTALQLGAGPALQGRAAGLGMLFTLGSAAIGAPLTGVLAQALGPRTAFWLAGAGCAGLAVTAFVAAARHRATPLFPAATTPVPVSAFTRSARRPAWSHRAVAEA